MSEPIRRPSLPSLPFQRDPRDRQEGRVFRWALAGAVVAHGLLLGLPLPTSTLDAAVEPPARPVFRVVNRHLAPPEPPEPNPPPRPVRNPTVTIPVPEWDDPEPLPRDEEPLPEPDPAAVDLGPVAFTDLLDVPPPPPEPGDGPVYVVGDVAPPEALYAPRPRYPEAAHRIGREGLVVLQAVIDRDGRVREVEVLRGAPFGMTEAAIEAVRDWRFRPATRDGAAVAVYYQLTVRFRRTG